jgi:uncharacterized membrane protein HdeD (DUF308 family)
MSNIIFGIGFTLVGVIGILSIIFGILRPVVQGHDLQSSSRTVRIILSIVGIVLCVVFIAAGIWNFTQL